MRRLWLIASILLYFQALDGQKAGSWESLPVNDPVHTIVLVGDVGHLDPYNSSRYTLDALKAVLNLESKRSSIVFLGDNIYPEALPEENDKSRERAEMILNLQLDILSDFKGRAFMIPGNYDWNDDGQRGLDNITRLEEYVESYYSDKDKIKFLPGKGCGSTKVRKAADNLAFIFIDSEWWFRNKKYNPYTNDHCDVKTRGDYLEEIRSALVKSRNDKVIVFMHHPVKSIGHHGGHYSLGKHIFPLTNIDKDLYIPLPIIGSIPSVVNNLYGSREDVSHPDYIMLMNKIVEMVKSLEMEVTFVSGHEHGLVYFKDEALNHIVSGTGSVSEHLGKNNQEIYANSQLGYSMIYVYEGEEMWVEFYVVNKDTGQASLDFRGELYPNNKSLRVAESPFLSIPDSQIFMKSSPSEQYNAGSLKKFWFGNQYRDIWSTAVNIPVINLEKEAGGLTPIKLGGGKSSNTIRFEGNDGHEYNLRSVDKFYYKTFGETFKNIKIFTIVQDMVSAHHPYAPLISAYLSESSGIYHTSPKLVYLKHQKALKGFNEYIPEGIYWYEQRPSDNWEEAPNFGFAKDIISYHDLLEKLRSKKNHFVDQEWVLKSRLLDMLIHDWDRHVDNWRWAVFKEGEKTIYRPIPRDRDMAFYKMEGIFPGVVANFVERKLLPMRDNIKDVRHLNENAGDFDRRFLNELEWVRWEAIADHFLSLMTDSVLNTSIDMLPHEVRKMNNEVFSSTLIKRRDNLRQATREFYMQSAQEVVIVGTDEQDLFNFHVDVNGYLEITQHIYSNHDKLILKYQRKFSPEETKRVIVHGLKGEDRFNIFGQSPSEIQIKLLGGGGLDKYINSSNSISPLVYDFSGSYHIEGQFDTRISDDVDLNVYHFDGYKYNRYYHVIDLGVNNDDGLWMSYGQMWKLESWPYTEYASRHQYSISFAPGSAQFLHLNYRGKFNNAFGKKLQFNPVVSYRLPTYVNYFGLGNESKNLNDTKSFNWVRMHDIVVNPNLEKSINYGKINLSFGPQYRSVKIINKKNRITDTEKYGFTQRDFERKHFFGLNANIYMGYQDHPRNPLSGFGLKVAGNYGFQPGQDKTTYGLSLSSNFYIPIIRNPAIVFANNIGMKYIWGEPEFYQYPSLGQGDNLRGWRKNRFRGEKVFFQNMDLRIHLADWKNVYLPMDVGLVAGFDYGRVWLSEEESDNYYSSWSFGLSLDILYLFTLHPYISLSEEETVFSLMSGLRF